MPRTGRQSFPDEKREKEESTARAKAGMKQAMRGMVIVRLSERIGKGNRREICKFSQRGKT